MAKSPDKPLRKCPNKGKKNVTWCRWGGFKAPSLAVQAEILIKKDLTPEDLRALKGEGYKASDCGNRGQRFCPVSTRAWYHGNRFHKYPDKYSTEKSGKSWCHKVWLRHINVYPDHAIMQSSSYNSEDEDSDGEDDDDGEDYDDGEDDDDDTIPQALAQDIQTAEDAVDRGEAPWAKEHSINVAEPTVLDGIEFPPPEAEYYDHDEYQKFRLALYDRTIYDKFKEVRQRSADNPVSSPAQSIEAAPSPTTAAPSMATAAPSTITAVPSATTAVPSSRIAAPSTTASAPSTAATSSSTPVAARSSPSRRMPLGQVHGNAQRASLLPHRSSSKAKVIVSDFSIRADDKENVDPLLED
ncbi:hypothetical protein CC80DRAFT_23602 [Byssothecium circinans]|uniref:Uncharacterized protein n=1 Tax=Byssothecium circinans TaxID=147558 RepID=A0A6A5U1Z1_9PLEO|nr:hypothetical protein CC80DRAFT_23602 [Byssothecium circinans]